MFMGTFTKIFTGRRPVLAALIALALGAGGVGYALRGASPSLSAFEPVASAEAASMSPLPTVALPDFSALVSKYGSAVVNITVEHETRRVALPHQENPFEGTPFGQFFRFGPAVCMPS